MKTTIRSSILVLGLVLLYTLTGCQKETESGLVQNSAVLSSPSLKNQAMNTFYGPTQPMGNGEVRAWVTTTKAGDPVAVGVNLSEKALENLPAEPTAFVLSLPQNKGMNFYKHVLLEWNPEGHEPPGIYDVPHFDVHFYVTSNSDRLAIGPLDPPAYDNPPAEQYQPPVYLQLPGRVPEMGAHWIDLLSDEFNGGSFTKTFIWGSYNGSFIFWEPMVTLAYLQSHPDAIDPVRQPPAFEKDGWYPQNYKVSYSVNPKQYTIALTGLEFRSGE